MKETARAIKVYTNLIIGASATVAAFLISPSSTVERIEKADNELRALRTILGYTHKYKLYVQSELNRLPFIDLQKAMMPSERMIFLDSTPPPTITTPPAPVPPDLDETTNEKNSDRPTIDESTTLSTREKLKDSPSPILEIVITESGVGRKSMRLFEWPEDPAEYAQVDFECFRQWGQCLPFRCGSLRPTPTVGEMDQFLAKHDPQNTDNHLAIFLPKSDEFAKRFRLLLMAYKTARLKQWRIISADPSDEMKSSKCSCYCASEWAKLEMKFEDLATKREIRVCTPVPGTWGCDSCQPLEVVTFVDWVLQQTDQGRANFDAVCEGFPNHTHKCLEGCHRIWSEISSKGIDEATTYVDLRIANYRERISLFGLTASVKSALVAFPLGTGTLLWLSWVHLSYLVTRIPSKRDEVDDIRDEWYGFMPQRRSIWTSQGLAAFPFIVLIILFQSDQSPSKWAYMSGLFLMISICLHSQMLWKVQQTLATVPVGIGNHEKGIESAVASVKE